MPDPSVLAEAALAVGFGALAGGLTNAVAIWMLFHPYRARGLGPFRLHGAIPKNQARLAKSIGRTVGERLLTPDDLARQLNAPELRDAFDRALSGLLDAALNRERRSPREELPPVLLGEIEATLQPVAARLAERLAQYVASAEMDELLGRHVALEHWVEQAVTSEELERAVRAFVSTQRQRLEQDQTPLLDRLPPGLVHAAQQAIADYLPIAVERVGDLLADPDARERIRQALKRFLDNAIRQLMLHERLVAKLVVRERTIDRVLAGLEGDGLGDIVELFHAPDFRAQIARAVNDAVVRFLRTPLAERLRTLGSARLDGLEQAAVAYVLSVLRAPRTQTWAVDQAHRLIALGRKALVEQSGQAWVAGTAHQAVAALLDRPIGRVGDLLPADTHGRLQHALADPLWSWIQEQVPVVVSQLSVQEIVEQKVLRFSVDRMEELIRRVTQRELNLIVYFGYLLGAVVGLGAFAIGQLIGGE